MTYAPNPKWCAYCTKHTAILAHDDRPAKRRITGGRIKTKCNVCNLHLCVRKGCFDAWHGKTNDDADNNEGGAHV